ncbi:hypothetical protein F2Q69_00035329 [Brassica cretica]|uniref:DUF223 domain-containing protein n=1 Tax=Brassica cretica TaxID=69181 RepID=A0A8S9SF43_BRACR|nr:hypothetical protein F2Q69_00035329 [Brassica cretica]
MQETIPTDTKAATTSLPAHSSCLMKIAYMLNFVKPSSRRPSHSLWLPLLLGFPELQERQGVCGMVLFLDEKVNSVIHGFTTVGRANHYMLSMKAYSIVKVDRFEVAMCSSMYKITNHQFLIRFISLTIIDEVITDVVGKIRSVQGSDLTKETTRVVIRLLVDP